MDGKFGKLKHDGENLRSIKKSHYDKYSGLHDSKNVVAKNSKHKGSKKNKKIVGIQENSFMNFVSNNKFMVILIMAIIMILVFGTFIYIRKKYGDKNGDVENNSSENDQNSLLAKEMELNMQSLKTKCDDLQHDNIIIGQNFEGLKNQYERLYYDYNCAKSELDNIKISNKQKNDTQLSAELNSKKNDKAKNINYKKFVDEKSSSKSNSESESETESDDEQEIDIQEIEQV